MGGGNSARPDSAQAGEVETEHILAPADGPRRTVTFRLRVYTATELARLLEDVGFAEIECFGDLDGGQLSRDSRLVVRAGKGVGVMVDLSSPVDADEELSGGQGKRQSNSSQWQRRRLGGDEASSRAVTNRRSTAHLPIADLKPRESRGRWWPSKSDQPRPSPRLPPSPNSKHRSDAYQKEGALVTSQPKIGISSTKLRPTQNSSASRSPLATPIGTSS